MKRALLLSLMWVVVGCAAIAPSKQSLQIRSDAVEIDDMAVERLLPKIAPSPVPSQKRLSEPLKTLLTFLAQTPPARAVKTKPHALSQWRIDRIYLLDDCVAVQFAEGHYMETIFFVKTPIGWRIAGRVVPSDHLL